METRFARPSTFQLGTAWFLLMLSLAGPMSGRGEAQVPGAEHVVVIGVDGLSPDGIRKPRRRSCTGS